MERTTTFAPVDTSPVGTAGLCFNRTVDRTLVHRRNLAEVFLTDIQHLGRTVFTAAAQLPMVHPYYTDRIGEPRQPDALLLLECCRQAETLAAHTVLGLGADTRFVLKDWSMELTATPIRAHAGYPVELAIVAELSDAVMRGKEARGMTYEMTMLVDEVLVGTTRLRVGYLPPMLYSALRHQRRGKPPLTSDEYVHPAGHQAVAPLRVGRTDPRNVVLADLRQQADVTSATLYAPVSHPSMFDHPLDHVPGMVLTEAARQLALLASDAPAAELATLQATFHHHTELDAPVTLTARPSTSDCVLVVVEQGELVTSEFTVGVR